MSNRDLPGVLHENAHRGYITRHGHQGAFNSERPDTGENIAAVLAVVDPRLIDQHLGEKVVDIGAGARGRLDDRHLAGQRVAATDAIDLPCIRRAHDRQQHAVAKRLLVGQVAGQEVRAFRGPAAHQKARNTCLAHAQSPSSSRLST
ncbi:hypothetical protein D3C71_718580 [compost metagenome]